MELPPPPPGPSEGMGVYRSTLAATLREALLPCQGCRAARAKCERDVVCVYLGLCASVARLAGPRLASTHQIINFPNRPASPHITSGTGGYPCARCYDYDIACVPQPGKMSTVPTSAMELLYRSSDPVVRYGSTASCRPQAASSGVLPSNTSHPIPSKSTLPHPTRSNPTQPNHSRWPRASPARASGCWRKAVAPAHTSC